MQILARKTKFRRLPLSLFIAVIQTVHLAAQDAEPPTPARSPDPTASNPAPANTQTPGPDKKDGANTNAASSALDYLYNRKPQEGTAAKQAADINQRANEKMIAADALGLGGQPDDQQRDRFEKYLGEPPVAASLLTTYEGHVDKLTALLRSNKTFEAWEELRELATYEKIDAGVSQELANRIESVWNTDKASTQFDKRNRDLQEDIKRSNSNADMMSKSIRMEDVKIKRLEGKNQPRDNKKPNGGVPQADAGGGDTSSSITSVAGLEGRLQLTEAYLRTLEAKAKIKFNELKAEKLLDQAKSNFADYIGTLYGSGRHRHVIIAADFYRRLFNESEYPVAMANQVNASLEVQRDVNSAIEVFRYKIGKGQLASATKRLQEAFSSSEFNPAVLGLDRDAKEKAGDYLAKLSKMQNLIEARDFGNLETLLQEVKAEASDFDATKPMAIVNAVKLDSKMHLGKAKLSAQQGDLKVAMEEFQSAAQAWPGNPDLQDKANTFFDTQDIKSQSLVEFDRLYKDGDYRQIFDKQLSLAPAMKDDQKRQDQLKEVLEKIKNAEIASEKANAMMVNGNSFGAWETIELAAKDLPDDRKLNKLRADYSSKSAEFVSSINKAKESEIRKEWGFSLTWYANAQRQYPASTMANEAIERISQEIISKSSL